MPKIPVVSGIKVIKALAKSVMTLIINGSHIILRQREPPHQRLTVPNHKEIAKGTLRAIIEDAGLTVKEFIDLV